MSPQMKRFLQMYGYVTAPQLLSLLTTRNASGLYSFVNEMSEELQTALESVTEERVVTDRDGE